MIQDIECWHCNMLGRICPHDLPEIKVRNQVPCKFQTFNPKQIEEEEEHPMLNKYRNREK